MINDITPNLDGMFFWPSSFTVSIREGEYQFILS